MEPSNTSPSPADHGYMVPARSMWRKIRMVLYPLLALLGAWLFLIVVMVAAAGWYTSRPQFCNSCHIMEPYYKSWQQSSHHEVACVECHFPPGIGGKVRGKVMGLVQVLKYVTASAGPRPTAEIDDKSCLRSGCHERRLLSGRVDFHVHLDDRSGAGRDIHIPFDHTPHMQEGRQGKTLRCTSCHSQIVQGSHMTVTPTTCFLCHFKEQPFNGGLSACTHCHQIPKKEFDLGGGVMFTHELAFKKAVDCAVCHADLIRGKGDVPRERCLSCHSREGDLARINDHVFMHAMHVTEHKVDCIQCHTPIVHRLEPDKIDRAANDCQSCHPNHHQEQVMVLKGEGARTVAAQPNMMLEVRAECNTCHRVHDVSPAGTVLLRGSYEMCAMCHDAGTVRQFETYHVALRGALPALLEALGKMEAAAKLPGIAADRAEKIAAEAADVRHDLLLLQRGNDAHNPHFAVSLERKSLERVAVLCKELKIEAPKLSLPPPLAPTPTSTRVEKK